MSLVHLSQDARQIAAAENQSAFGQGEHMGKHIRDMANSLIGQLHLTEKDEGKTAFQLWFYHVSKLEKIVQKMNPATLGRIVAQGSGFMAYLVATPMHEVFEGHESSYAYIDPRDTGIKQLQQLACIALIAEIHDALHKRKWDKSDIGKALSNGTPTTP